jgi:hypothetical protein
MADEWPHFSPEHQARIRQTPEMVAHMRTSGERPHHGAPTADVEAHWVRVRASWHAVTQTEAFKDAVKAIKK